MSTATSGGGWTGSSRAQLAASVTIHARETDKCVLTCKGATERVLFLVVARRRRIKV